MENRIVLTVGLPASGKDTWADEQVRKSNGKIKKISKDGLRALLDCNKWSGDREKFVLRTRDNFIKDCMHTGYSVIVCDTNLHPKHVKRVTDLVSIHNETEGTVHKYQVEVNDSFLEVPYKTCVARDLKRENSVGERVIRQMYLQHVLKVDRIKQDESLPHVIICDLDGTLCNFSGNPYERDFSKDTVSEPVKKILLQVCNPVANIFYNSRIIFLSGRSGKYEEVTRKWLDEKVFGDLLPEFLNSGTNKYELHMRKEGDSRSDMIVKKELFDEFVRGKYYVDFVIDDRKQIGDLWLELGLFLFNVNQTNEEF